MKITAVTPVLLTGPISDDPSMHAFRTQRSAAFVEIHTDAGHVGIGETYLGYHLPQVVPAIVEYFAPILLAFERAESAPGFDIPELRSRLVACSQFWGRVGVGATVISAIEAALWDLNGKLLGVPAYQLLGGLTHDRLLGYATGGPSNWPMDQLRSKVDRYLAAGFRAFKLGAGRYSEAGQLNKGETPEHTAELEATKVSAIRDHVGAGVGMMFDAHMGFRSQEEQWGLHTATLVLNAVAPFGVEFYEEALPYNDPDAYAELAAHTTVRVAGGEQLTTAGEFAPYANAHSFDVAQPDAAWLSMSDFVEVAAMFAATGAQVASHAWSAGGGVMQNLHAALACPNTLVVEIPPLAGALHTEVWGDSLQLDGDGCVLPPTEPGLGVRLTTATKERLPFRPGSEEWVDVPGKLMPRPEVAS
ncbi:MAG: mandelate racemase/muconate lactonizing enzyme family protein [Nakamurella sp.]